MQFEEATSVNARDSKALVFEERHTVAALVGGGAFTRSTDAEVLRLTSCTIEPDMFSNILRKTKITELRLENVSCKGNGHLRCLNELPSLKVLEINKCPDLTDRYASPLMNLKLERLIWGVKELTKRDVGLLNASEAEISLIYYSPSSMNDLCMGMFSEIERLRELMFVDFGDSAFPAGVTSLAHLTKLSFKGGRLAASEADHGASAMEWGYLPDHMVSLELSCKMDRTVTRNLLLSGSHITNLVLHADCISAMPELERCSNLRTLKLFAKELTGEFFANLEFMNNLETLHFGGCPDLTGNDFNSLINLKHLRELSVHCSCFRREACEVLSSLRLIALKLHCCFGISALPFIQLPYLKCLWVVDCVLDEAQLRDLISSDFIDQLNDFRIRNTE